MGMLMHRTLLEQRNKAKAKAEDKRVEEEKIPFTEPEENPEEAPAEVPAEAPVVKKETKPKAPAKKPAAKRKSSK